MGFWGTARGHSYTRCEESRVQLPYDNVQQPGVITDFRWTQPGAMDT